MKLIKGNEQDCICEKPNGHHRKKCDEYRLKVFLEKAIGVITNQDTAHKEDWLALIEFIK